MCKNNREIILPIIHQELAVELASNFKSLESIIPIDSKVLKYDEKL